LHWNIKSKAAGYGNLPIEFIIEQPIALIVEADRCIKRQEEHEKQPIKYETNHYYLSEPRIYQV